MNFLSVCLSLSRLWRGVRANAYILLLTKMRENLLPLTISISTLACEWVVCVCVCARDKIASNRMRKMCLFLLSFNDCDDVFFPHLHLRCCRCSHWLRANCNEINDYTHLVYTTRIVRRCSLVASEKKEEEKKKTVKDFRTASRFYLLKLINNPRIWCWLDSASVDNKQMCSQRFSYNYKVIAVQQWLPGPTTMWLEPKSINMFLWMINTAG